MSREPESEKAALRWATLDKATASAWSRLVNVLATADSTGETYEPEDLVEELTESGFDPQRDSWAVWDGDTLVAYGQLRVAPLLVESRWCQAWLDGGVHPAWRGRGIGTALMNLMELRARELAAQRHPAAPLRFRAAGGLPDNPVRRLLAHRGYWIARYFTDMQRALPGPDVESAGDGPQPYRAELAEQVRLAHNEAFGAHWGSIPRTPEAWRDWVESRAFRPDTSTVFQEHGGDVCSYVLTYQWADRELYVGQGGTRPHARGRGLARACLATSLRVAAASGRYDTATLTVDSANPTGAGTLYESLGFTAVRTVATFIRDEP